LRQRCQRSNSARSAQLVRIVQIVAEEANPILVHCSAGKDRTGVLAEHQFQQAPSVPPEAATAAE